MVFTKFHLNILYTLSLNLVIMYFNAIVNVVEGSISNSADYKTLPRVYDYNQECVYQNNENLASCSAKAWHNLDHIQLKEHLLMEKSDLNLDSCMNLCSTTSDCVAIGREYDKNKCFIYGRNYKQEGNKKYNSYLLKCCSLKKYKKPELNQHLPIVIDPSKSCIPQTDNNLDTCKYKAFYHRDKKDYNLKDYNFTYVKNTFECMSKCLEKKGCKTFGFQSWMSVYIECFHYGKGGDVNYWENSVRHTFQMICCKVNDENLWKSKSTNLLMLHQPHKLCKAVSTKNEKCEIKIWQLEDDLRMNGEYKSMRLEISTCLNECANNAECIGVSFDWIDVRCLLFKERESTNLYGHKRWTSYLLKCCEGFKDEINVAVTSSVLKNKNLPIVYDVKKECLPQGDENLDSCSAKAWHAIDKAQLKNHYYAEEDNMTVGSCLNLCSSMPECVAVTRDQEKDKCFLHGRNYKIEYGGTNVKAFFLKCCELRKEINQRQSSSSLERNYLSLGNFSRMTVFEMSIIFGAIL